MPETVLLLEDLPATNGEDDGQAVVYEEYYDCENNFFNENGGLKKMARTKGLGALGIPQEVQGALQSGALAVVGAIIGDQAVKILTDNTAIDTKYRPYISIALGALIATFGHNIAGNKKMAAAIGVGPIVLGGMQLAKGLLPSLQENSGATAGLGSMYVARGAGPQALQIPANLPEIQRIPSIPINIPSRAFTY